MTKEDIKQICQIYDNFRSERNTATIAYNSDDTFWEDILATYNLSQSSLPSNLEEAAKEYAKTTFKKPHSDNPDEEVTIVEPDKYAGFIAGTKWQKEQMMSKAVKAQFVSMDERIIKYDPIVSRRLKQHFHSGEWISIIIVKED